MLEKVKGGKIDVVIAKDLWIKIKQIKVKNINH